MAIGEGEKGRALCASEQATGNRQQLECRGPGKRQRGIGKRQKGIGIVAAAFKFEDFT